MSIKKWRVAQAVEGGSSEEVDRLSSSQELRRYAVALEDVERLLVAQRGEARACAPADLGARIMDSVRETERMDRRMWAIPAGPSRPLLVLAAAAMLGGVMTLGVYVAGPLRPSAVVPPEAGPIAVREGRVDPGSLDPAFAIVPAGRLVFDRVESPLLNEAELLKRDTQHLTEMVLSSLPFASGLR